MPKLVYLGSANTDLITFTPSFACPNETLHATSFSQGFGGKAANSAICAARLVSASSVMSTKEKEGYVAFVGCVGQDTYGSATKSNFESNSVDISGLLTATQNVSSGLASITVNDQGENIILIVGGANELVDTTHIDNLASNRGMLSKESQTQYLIVQFEIPLITTLYAIKIAQQNGVKVILNPSPVKPMNELPEKLLGLCDILVVNEHELGVLSGLVTSTVEECKAAVNGIMSTSTLDAFIEALCIVTTLGSDGCLLSECSPKSEVKHTHVPSPILKDKVVDTTGAGDCFISTLSYLLTLTTGAGMSMVEACKLSNEVAGFSVGKKGAQGSYPVGDEVCESVRNAPGRK